MNIAVCIKQVPVSNEVEVDPVTHNLVRESNEGMVNPADLNALEAALQLKSEIGAHVVVFSMGPLDAEKSLYHALAMGADEACLITGKEFAGADTIATAYALQKALEQHGDFSLIFTGQESADGATAQVGPMLAQMMDRPHVSAVLQLSVPQEEAVIVEKRTGTKKLRLQMQLPALVSIAYGCNDARLPTLRSQMKAKKLPIVHYSKESLALCEKEIGLLGSPTDVMCSSQIERDKTANMLHGDTAELANQILCLIEKEKGNS